LLLTLTACSNVKENESVGGSSEVSETAPPQSSTVSAAPEQSSVLSVSTVQASSTEPLAQSETNPVQTQPPQPDMLSKPTEASQPSNEKEELKYMMNIQIGENLLTATLEHNSSAEALLKLLSEGPVTIHMSDYAGMEKVGTLPSSLPRNDRSINTDACDLILYQGDQFVIYYDTNSWSLTRLGRINNTTQSELKKILGAGDVTAVLSLA